MCNAFGVRILFRRYSSIFDKRKHISEEILSHAMLWMDKTVL